jgi:DNA-binding NarL/FixJ family response regulator
MGERTSAESSVDSVSGERQVPHFDRRRIRAVVADDSSDWRCVIAALLEMENDVEVVAHVENGQEAIEAVTLLQPELAIIDLRIGSLDVLTTTSLLRHQFPLLDVILMADHDSPRLRATCQASGTKYVVQKTKFHEQFPLVLAQIRDGLRVSAVVGNDAK